MVYQTSVSLWMTDDVRIKQLVLQSAPEGRVLTISSNGTDLQFIGPVGKLLAYFRAIEHALLEGDEDMDVHLGGEPDDTEPF